MRKSKPVSTKGNSDKFNRYKEAMTRIEKSIADEFFLEAVAIEESVFSDRLKSFLAGKEKIKKTEKFIPFGNLVKKAEGELGDKLYRKLQEWRELRNKTLHSIVRQETKNLEEFLENAARCAKDGLNLIKELMKWHRKEYVAHKKKVASDSLQNVSKKLK